MNLNDPYLTISLTGRRPVKIHKPEWPIVAKAKGYCTPRSHDGGPPDPPDACKLFVRRHTDGRAIVYGIRESEREQREGFILDSAAEDNEVEEKLTKVGDLLDVSREVLNNCLAELPAEEL
jgi:hypothetical protein